MENSQWKSYPIKAAMGLKFDGSCDKRSISDMVTALVHIPGERKAASSAGIIDGCFLFAVGDLHHGEQRDGESARACTIAYKKKDKKQAMDLPDKLNL